MVGGMLGISVEGKVHRKCDKQEVVAYLCSSTIQTLFQRIYRILHTLIILARFLMWRICNIATFITAKIFCGIQCVHTIVVEALQCVL